MSRQSARDAARDILKVCQDEYERAARVWKPVHEAILEERLFYEGDHYDDEIERHERRAAALRFVGQETFNVGRHKCGQLTDSPRTIEARPVDENSSADDAETAVSLLEWETGHPQKLFDDYVDLMCLAAVSARIGVIWIDWDPDLGPWGEILFRPGDAAKMMWTPGYHDPHDLRCDWLMEERAPTLAMLERMRGTKGFNGKVLDQLKADAGVTVNRGTASGTDVPRQDPGIGKDQPKDVVQVRWWWWKNDRTMKQQDRPQDAHVLPPDERYMVCGAPGAPGCGWRSPMQSQSGSDLPEATDNGCPECQGPTMRVDQKQPYDELLVYPKGKRLVLEVVKQGVDEPLYDGPWPTVVLNPKRNVRSFPVYVMTGYLPSDPSKPTGPSDTSLNWSAQAASDFLMTKGFQSAAQYQRYYVMPETGVNDYNGLRFEFRDDQFNVMFRNPADQNVFGPNGMSVQAVEGSQFDPNLPAYWGMVQQVLNSKQGIADFGFTPQNSKDIPATTVAQLTQQSEIPIEHLKRRFHRALGRGDGVLWDYICATYPADRLARMRLNDGMDAVVNVRGDELANFDFVISDSPTFSGLEKAKSEALDKLITVPPEWQELYAEVNNLPKSILRKVQKQQAELAAKAAAMPQPGPPGVPAGPMNGAPPPPGGPQALAGAMQSGMPQMVGAGA